MYRVTLVHILRSLGLCKAVTVTLRLRLVPVCPPLEVFDLMFPLFCSLFNSLSSIFSPRCDTYTSRIYTFYGASMSINVFSPVLLGFNDGHWILLAELDCFGALFLLGFVPLALVQAWMVLNSDG